MATNAEILTAFFTQVSDWASVPVSYPGKTFDQPNTGQWLEISHAPNDSDTYLSDQRIDRRGILQINACCHPNDGVIDLYQLAEGISAEWHKLTVITGTVAVTRTPWLMTPITTDEAIRLPVSIEYSS